MPCSSERAYARSRPLSEARPVARHSIHCFGYLPSYNVLCSPPVNGIAEFHTSTVEKGLSDGGMGSAGENGGS